MRAFAEGYYMNLIRMYNYLGVHFRSQPFIFSFEKAVLGETSRPAKREPYFIHSSNNHRLPPLRPRGMSFWAWIMSVAYVAFWYFWWSACCFFFVPRPASGTQECESLKEYVERVRLPGHFVNFYLLPLLSSVATCTHDDLMQFPAKDLTDYKKRSAGKNHYTVAGVYEVQKRLGKGVDARLSATVTKVEALAGQQVEITWVDSKFEQNREIFDRVVLAVAPDVVGRIFTPLEKAMKKIPSALVRNFVQGEGMTLSVNDESAEPCTLKTARTAQIIHFRTSTTLGQTESIHVQPSGARVTTCPLDDTYASANDVLCSAQFRRALRTPLSRRVVNSIFGGTSEPAYQPSEKESGWRNSDDNVWLVGGWCWDGMVLLEGCIVSAMRVARDFDVEVPWGW
jgi:hypothetical protein